MRKRQENEREVVNKIFNKNTPLEEMHEEISQERKKRHKNEWEDLEKILGKNTTTEQKETNDMQDFIKRLGQMQIK